MTEQIIESVINNDGMTLVGEAAQQFITYKYVTYFTDIGITCFWVFTISGLIIWRGLKNYKRYLETEEGRKKLELLEKCMRRKP